MIAFQLVASTAFYTRRTINNSFDARPPPPPPYYLVAENKRTPTPRPSRVSIIALINTVPLVTIVHGFPKPLENITLPRFIPPTLEQLYQSGAGGRETIATSFFILYRPGSPDTSRKSVKLTRTNFAISHLGGKLLLACAKGPTFGKKSYFPKTFGSRYWRTLEPVEYITENNFRTRFLLG